MYMFLKTIFFYVHAAKIISSCPKGLICTRMVFLDITSKRYYKVFK